ncbi:hypothetical protein [Streptomyces altiplanensis]
MTTSAPNARAVLRDFRFVVPEAPAGGAPGTVRRLRGAVAPACGALGALGILLEETAS